MRLIDDIKSSMELEIRVSPGQDLRFEAVFQAKDLDVLRALLEDNIGMPLKGPGEQLRFSKRAKEVVDHIGGLRSEQSFYFKEEASGEYIYAALWPWQSDPSRITLKIGRGSF